MYVVFRLIKATSYVLSFYLMTTYFKTKPKHVHVYMTITGDFSGKCRSVRPLYMLIDNEKCLLKPIITP